MAIIVRRNKDGSSRYQVKVRDRNGNWYPMPSFDDAHEAKRHELALHEENRKGNAKYLRDARITTFADYTEVWRHANRTEVSDGWKKSQDQMIRDHLEPVLGRRLMVDIQAPEVGSVLIRAKERGLGDSMRLHLYVLMRQMFGDAVEYYQMLTKNPVSPKHHRPTVVRKKRNFLEPPEALRLLAHVKGHYLGPAVWIPTLSAPRIGEVQMLKGANLQFDRSQILIAGTWDRKMKRPQEYPKGKDWAYVPMPPMLREYLQGLNIGPDEYVAKGIKGGMLSYHTFQKALKVLCRNAGVPVVTPHELRHSCTEIWITAGASEEDIRRLLNHASTASTKTYIHRTEERLQRIAGEVGKPALKLVSAGT